MLSLIEIQQMENSGSFAQRELAKQCRMAIEDLNDVQNRVHELRRYLESDKFSKDTTVQAKDVLNRLGF